MEYQKNKVRPRFKKINRPLGFKGYYVEVRDGEDAIRAYRKIKRWMKEDKFVEQVRSNNTFQKPSEIKRETNKRLKRQAQINRRKMMLRD